MLLGQMLVRPASLLRLGLLPPFPPCTSETEAVSLLLAARTRGCGASGLFPTGNQGPGVGSWASGGNFSSGLWFSCIAVVLSWLPLAPRTLRPAVILSPDLEEKVGE